jgi:hypothetical protein
MQAPLLTNKDSLRISSLIDKFGDMEISKQLGVSPIMSDGNRSAQIGELNLMNSLHLLIKLIGAKS